MVHYPSLNLKAGFAPLFDLSIGDVGSDLPQRIAEITREPSDIIASKLVFSLPDFPKRASSIIEGFINYRFTDDEILAANAESYHSTLCSSSPIIIVPSVSHFSSASSFARILSSAYLQAIFWAANNYSPQLIVGSKILSIQPITTLQPGARLLLAHADGLRDILNDASDSGARHQMDYEQMVKEWLSVYFPQAGQSVFMWGYSDQAWSKPFREFNKMVRDRADFSLVKTVERDWLIGFVEEIDCQFLSTLSDEDLGKFLVYLAGADTAQDIDPETPLRPYKACFLNHLIESKTRYERVVGSRTLAMGPPRRAGSASLSIPERDILARSLFLKGLSLRAAETVQISEFMTVLSSLLDRFNILLNERNFRDRLSRNDISFLEHKILTSLGACLSDMVKLF